MEKMQEAGDRRLLDGAEQPEKTHLQNKGNIPYCERLMASLVNTDSTRDRPVVWRVL